MSSLPSQSGEGVFLRILPVTLAVFTGFLTIGLALPVLPLHIHDALHLSPLAVGVTVGCQFVVSLLSRGWAGAHADTRGAKHALLTGFVVSAVSGVIYLLSLLFLKQTILSAAVLLGGRFVLGYGESLMATGALSWCVGLAGPKHAGKVMAWVGMGIYAAYSIGAPAGTAIYRFSGFAGISVATLIIPLMALLIVLPVAKVVPPSAQRVPFYKVVGAVWLPGLGLSFASMGFGTLTAFIALQFSERGWSNGSLAFTSFGAAFILARLLFGGLPDRLGGAKVALVSVVIEAAGQLLIWGAPDVLLTYLGAALTGFGYSLAFPGFGVEAVRRAPPQSRGVAMGAYVAFMDLALGIAGPSLGFVANRHGVGSVYLVSSGIVLGAVAIAVSLLIRPLPKTAEA